MCRRDHKGITVGICILEIETTIDNDIMNFLRKFNIETFWDSDMDSVESKCILCIAKYAGSTSLDKDFLNRILRLLEHNLAIIYIKNDNNLYLADKLRFLDVNMIDEADLKRLLSSEDLIHNFLKELDVFEKYVEGTNDQSIRFALRKMLSDVFKKSWIRI
jgi:hypothetical protein